MTRFLHSITRTARRPWLSWLVSAIMLVVTVGAFTDFLMEHLGTWQTAVLALAVTIVIVLLVRPLESLTAYIKSFRHTEVTVEESPRKVRRHRGLIVLSSIGGGIGSAEAAIRYHWKGLEDEHSDPVLEQCWIITSGSGSEQSATDMLNKLVHDGIPAKRFHLKALSVDDADNPEAVHRLVDGIYTDAVEQFGLEEKDVIADYTGGTKSMTSGMVLACTSPERPLQFMKPRRYQEDGRADSVAGADPVAIDIRFKLVPQA